MEKSLKKTLLKQQEIIKVKLDTEKFNRIRYKAQHGPNLIWQGPIDVNKNWREILDFMKNWTKLQFSSVH